MRFMLTMIFSVLCLAFVGLSAGCATAPQISSPRYDYGGPGSPGVMDTNVHQTGERISLKINETPCGPIRSGSRDFAFDPVDPESFKQELRMDKACQDWYRIASREREREHARMLASIRAESHAQDAEYRRAERQWNTVERTVTNGVRLTCRILGGRC